MRQLECVFFSTHKLKLLQMNRRICFLVSFKLYFYCLSGKSVQTHQQRLKVQLQYTSHPMPMLETSSVTCIVRTTVGFTSCFLCSLHMGHLTLKTSVNKDRTEVLLLILHEGHSTLGFFIFLNDEKQIVLVNFADTMRVSTRSRTWEIQPLHHRRCRVQKNPNFYILFIVAQTT